MYGSVFTAIAILAIASNSAHRPPAIDFLPNRWHLDRMIKRIKFLGIPVADQDRALRFYTEKLGFRILTDQEFNEKQRWIELSIPGAETGISLFTPEGLENRVGTFLNTSWEVENIAKTYDELTARGVEFAKPPEKQPWGTYAVLKDSEGNQIVLSSR